MHGACIEDVNHEIYGGIYAQRIFGESFEEPAPNSNPQGWQIYGGTWTPDGSGIHVQGGSGFKIVRRMPALADGTVEASVAVSNDMGDNAGLLVRVSNPGVGADAFDGYEIALGAKARRLILGKHRHDFHLLQSVPAPIVPGRWHRLRVACEGPRIRVYLDGETAPRIDFTDRDAPLTSGAIALRTWNANASFRDVRVDGKKIPTSFAGPGASGMWDSIGSEHGRLSLEGSAFNGALCQKIVHAGSGGTIGVANRGLNRWGIAVRSGHPMDGRIYLKSRGLSGPVTVALQSADGSRTYATQKLSPGRSWAKSEFRLKPNATDPNARFAIWIDHPGEVWVDQVVLFDAPTDRFRGLPIRGDIAQELIGSGIKFLRYGGTMINVPGYRWKNMIGDPDRRPPYAGHWYPCSTNGFGIFEFLQFCEAAKLGAAFAINAEETPEDAADLADYLTAATNTRWGKRRAADGHPEPYRFEYIEIGNEEAIGNPDPDAMAHYADRFNRLAQAIHGHNPKTKLVCSAWWIPDAPHMKTVFDAVDGQATAWDLHFWCDDANAGTNIGQELERAQKLFKSWNPETDLKAVVFEENGNRHDLQRALGHATTVNATKSHGDFVLADCTANALQPWKQNDNGWDQGTVFFTTDHAWSMPPADAQQLLSRDALPLRVAAKVEGGLDVLATRSEDGRTLVLTVVNVTDQPIPTQISFGQFNPAKAQISTLEGELTAANPPIGEKNVVPRQAQLKIEGEDVSITFSARSITSIRLTK